MRRSLFHLRRYQLLQMAGDLVLVSLAFFLAFQLRFLDDNGTIPSRYMELFVVSVGFVAVGKVLIFHLFGLYQKWWRFVGGRDISRIVRTRRGTTATSSTAIGSAAVRIPSVRASR